MGKREVNKAAALLGKMRWKGIPADQRSEAAAKASSARMDKITAERRSEIAATASKSRSTTERKRSALKAWETRRKNLELKSKSA